jgi:hypothetical protein
MGQVDATTTERLKVFISYSRRDSADFADELVAGLELAGFAPSLDRHDITPGEPWEARLGGLIQKADTVVFVVSPEAIKSEHCVWEVAKTVELSKRLIPVIFKPVPDTEIPEKLRKLQFVRFDGGQATNAYRRPRAEARGPSGGQVRCRMMPACDRPCCSPSRPSLRLPCAASTAAVTTTRRSSSMPADPSPRRQPRSQSRKPMDPANMRARSLAVGGLPTSREEH